MTTITRQEVGKRMSQIVTHGDTIYLSGQIEGDGESITSQTQKTLAQIDRLLEKAGSNKEHILQAVIWLANMDDFAEMNAVWDEWVPEGKTPARACGQSRLVVPEVGVEITIIAAKA